MAADTTVFSKRSLAETMGTAFKGVTATAVIKATDSECKPPKEKHIEAVLLHTHKPKSMESCIEGVFGRLTTQQVWIVLYKAMILSHRVMRDGHLRFFQTMATRTQHFDQQFIISDSDNAETYAAYLQRYGQYLNQCVQFYRVAGFSLTHAKSGDDIKYLGKKKATQLFKEMKTVQDLLSALLECGNAATTPWVQNPVIQYSFTLLFKDAQVLFVALSEGCATLLSQFFSASKKNAQISTKLYERYCKQCKNLVKFEKLCEQIAASVGQKIPGLSNAQTSLLPKLKTHLASFGGGATASPGPTQDTNSGFNNPAPATKPQAANPFFSDPAPNTATADPFAPAVDPFAPAPVVEAPKKAANPFFQVDDSEA